MDDSSLRNQETAERLAEEMAIIAEIGRVVSSTLDINQVFEWVDAEVRKLIPYDRLLVNLKKNDGNEFVVVYASGVDNPARRLTDSYPSQGTATGIVMNTRTGILIQPTDAEEIKDLYPNLYETFEAGLRSTMSVPLISMNEVIGSMNFRSEKLKAYTEQDLRIAEKIGMQVAGAIANARLFDDLSKTEKSLRESEERLRDILFSIADWLWEVDENGVYTFSSQKGFDLFGESRGNIIGKTPFGFMPPDEAKRVAAIFSEIVANKAPIKDLENWNIRKNGERVCLLTNGVPILDEEGNLKGYRGVDKDITERKMMEAALKASEEALRESEVKFRGIYEESPIGIELYDREGTLLDTNRACLEIFGVSDVPAVKGFKLLEDPNLSEGLKAQLRRGESVHYEIPFDFEKIRALKLYETTKSGTIYLDLLITPLRGVTKESAVGYLVHIRDITDRKRAEEALKERNDFIENLLENAPIGFAVNTIDDGRVMFVSRNFENIYGVPPDSIRGVDDFFEKVYLDPVFREEIRERIMADMMTGEAARMRWENIPITTQAGEHKVVTATNIPLLEQNLMISTVQDVTERKRAEEEKRNLQERLQRAEKMEALGQLAGGVAHDLNNVLGILSGYSELLLQEIPEGHRSRRHVEKILQSTEKGAAIIQDLLTLARRGVTASDVINLNSVVSGFLKTPVFERIKGYHPCVTFRTECDKELLNIKGSSIHMEKTVMNLVSNAAEAISGNGEVVIRTENHYLDTPLRGYEEIKHGDYVVLTVSDTGMGIPAEDREKIFEPFYTKKKMGRSGTGLGLAIVWGTVKDHNGYIDVQTGVGEGTVFTLYFPVTREELIAPQQKVPIGRYMGNGESALVVDDVAEQRDIAAGLLTRLGYEVHVVSSGEEAVEYLKRNKTDILVLDMIMAPGIDGLETYQRVLEVNPKQKAILVSGFSETDRVREAQKLGAGAYIKKPYLMEKIGVAIREELDGK
ncbi:MAG: PAS domain S-box protein [Syntrophales bacterium]|nr:PAS domain S-box protein [Syntrophales bacterium]